MLRALTFAELYFDGQFTAAVPRTLCKPRFEPLRRNDYYSRLYILNLDLFAGSDILLLFSGFFNGSFGGLGHDPSYCNVSDTFYCSMQLLRASRQSLHYALRLGWAHNQTSWYGGLYKTVLTYN